MTEAPKPWLTIIGIGDNGAQSLSPEAWGFLTRAKTVVVSGRVAAGLDLTSRAIINWEDGFEQGLAAIRSHAGSPVTVLATGDPMHFGIGATLRKYFGIEEMLVLPAPSAFSLAAARLGWPLQNVDCISLHGRPIENLIRYLAPRNRILVLTSDGASIPAIAKILIDAGYGGSLLHILEHMGGERENIRQVIAHEAVGQTFADFNTLAIDCAASAKVLPKLAGLEDEAFRHDGQLTKAEIRAITLARLKPYPGALLWDVGAGCGSVAIEWMRAARNAHAIAIEEKISRVEMIRLNAASLGTPSLEIIHGEAPDALAGLASPDSIFIGGGITHEGIFIACWQALRPGGHLVANAVTLEGEAQLTRLRKLHGGEMVRVSVARAAPVGRFCGWKSLMPVTTWSVQKDEERP